MKNVQNSDKIVTPVRPDFVVFNGGAVKVYAMRSISIKLTGYPFLGDLALQWFLQEIES